MWSGQWWAVIIGSAIHLAVCLPPLWSRWGLIRPRLDLRTDPRFMRVLGEMGKVAIIGVMAQVNTLVLRYIASHLQEGAVTWYWNATRLVDFAQGIIAVGVGSALLPAISAAAAEGDGERFRSAFTGAARLAGVLLIPAAAVILAFPEPCVALLSAGAYLVDVTQTASACRCWSPSCGWRNPDHQEALCVEARSIGLVSARVLPPAAWASGSS